MTLKELIRTINGRCNMRPYTIDMELYQDPEILIYLMTGECSDYLINKATMLLDEGFPADKLRAVCVATETGELHAVLMATVEDGEWVLDNRHMYVTRFSETNYTIVEPIESFNNRWFVSARMV